MAFRLKSIRLLFYKTVVNKVTFVSSRGASSLHRCVHKLVRTSYHLL